MRNEGKKEDEEEGLGIKEEKKIEKNGLFGYTRTRFRYSSLSIIY